MENTSNTFMPAFLPIAKACVRAMVFKIVLIFHD